VGYDLLALTPQIFFVTRRICF